MLRTIIFLVILFFSLAGVGQTQAQDSEQEELCRIVVDRALNEVAFNCANLGPNEMCYGSGEVEATLFGAENGYSFSQVGDRAPLERLAALSVGGYDPTVPGGSIGVVALNIKANLPNNPDQYVNLVLVGQNTLINAVSPDRALLFDADPISVAVAAETASLLSIPPEFEGTISFANISGIRYNSRAVGSVNESEVLTVDAIDDTGTYVRVHRSYNSDFATNTTTWIETEALDPEADYSTLPIVMPLTQSPLQVFMLESGPSEICGEATGRAVVAGPEGIEVEFLVNASAQRIASAIIMQAFGSRGAVSNSYTVYSRPYHGRLDAVCVTDDPATSVLVTPGNEVQVTGGTIADIILHEQQMRQFFRALQSVGLSIMPDVDGALVLTDPIGSVLLIYEDDRLWLGDPNDESTRYEVSSSLPLALLNEDGEPVEDLAPIFESVLSRLGQAVSGLAQVGVTVDDLIELHALNTEIYSQTGAVYNTFSCIGAPSLRGVGFLLAEQDGRVLLRLVLLRLLPILPPPIADIIREIIEEIIITDPSAIGGASLP